MLRLRLSTYLYKVAFKCLKNVFASVVWDQQPVSVHLEGCQWVTVELAGSLDEEVSGGHCGKNISSLGLDYRTCRSSTVAGRQLCTKTGFTRSPTSTAMALLNGSTL